jgi:chemotaxis signal transduction protein
VVERADGAGGRWVFGVDEVAGVQQVVRSTMRSVPSTVSQSNARMCQALFDWQDRTVGLIDDARLLDGLAELIAH